MRKVLQRNVIDTWPKTAKKITRILYFVFSSMVDMIPDV